MPPVDEEQLLPKQARLRATTHGPGRVRQYAHSAVKTSLGLVLLVAACKLLLFASGYSVAVSIGRHGQHRSRLHVTGPDSDLDERPALATKAPRPNVWLPISAEDNAAVWRWLHDPAQGLNLTLPELAGINDNKVYWIDTVPVNKSAVLPFVDGDGPRPPSFARVVVYEGGKPVPVVQEYMVGPLPVGAATTVAKLDYIFNGGSGGTVPYNARGVDAATLAAIDGLLAPVMAGLADITAAVYGGAQYWGAGDNRTNLVMSAGTPGSFDGTTAHMNIVFQFQGPARYLLPLDLYVLVNWTGTDTRLWTVRGFVTRERFFASAAALRSAFDAGELWSDIRQRQDYDWALVKQQPALGERPLERRVAPQSREVGGKRYKVDAQEQYVEYMGWSFYVGASRPLGPMFYDVRFKGERILYELSLQEAASQYGGFQPKAGSTVYHDASYSLGANLYPLVPAFDCPAGSTFWNVSFHDGNTTVVRRNAICLFEQDPGHPLSRHRATERDGKAKGGSSYIGVVKDAALHVRFIATVGNYDYIFDYAFGLDGAIGITVRASGYLMSSPWYRDQGRFGPRIQQATQGSIHDHVLTFKADFDIAGSTANSLERTQLVAAVQEAQPWFADMGAFEQLRLQSDLVDVEQPLSWAPNGDTAYTVLGSAMNAWGERRGYRIVPGLSNMHLTTLRSPWSQRNMAFAKSHLAVTRQHDTEPFANSVHNANLPAAPHVDFAQFMDGESVRDADLVVWFNLGMHHFTRAEDIPVTLFSEAVTSITLAPHNFFDRAQDGDLTNRMWEEGGEEILD